MDRWLTSSCRLGLILTRGGGGGAGGGVFLKENPG
jgi:hypothetical protein